MPALVIEEAVEPQPLEHDEVVRPSGFTRWYGRTHKDAHGVDDRLARCVSDYGAAGVTLDLLGPIARQRIADLIALHRRVVTENDGRAVVAKRDELVVVRR